MIIDPRRRKRERHLSLYIGETEEERVKTCWAPDDELEMWQIDRNPQQNFKELQLRARCGPWWTGSIQKRKPSGETLQEFYNQDNETHKLFLPSSHWTS